MGAEGSKQFNLYIKISMDRYSDRVTYTLFTVTVTQAGCDCSYMLWSDPSSVANTITVGSTNTVSVPVPTADTSNRSTVAAFDNCWVISTGCDAFGTFATSSITDS